MDWTSGFSLNFQPPDFARFPALKLAYLVAEAGGTAGAVLNAANEVAVSAFLEEKITFDAICRVVELTIDRHHVQRHPTLDDLMQADLWARQAAQAIVQSSAQIPPSPFAEGRLPTGTRA
jgi:1-deoxy-D-xylulose-5-phosphate reductoisomerase